jgi:hypothetical protein
LLDVVDGDIGGPVRWNAVCELTPIQLIERRHVHIAEQKPLEVPDDYVLVLGFPPEQVAIE